MKLIRVTVAAMVCLTAVYSNVYGQNPPSLSDVQFSCTARTQTSCNGPAEVDVHYKNLRDRPLAVRYDLHIWNDNGAEKVIEKLGRSEIRPGADYEEGRCAGERRVNTPDVLPVRCQLRRVQVCPAQPPKGWPASAYYRPFLDGKCSSETDLTPVTLNLRQPQKDICSARFDNQVALDSTAERYGNSAKHTFFLVNNGSTELKVFYYYYSVVYNNAMWSGPRAASLQPGERAYASACFDNQDAGCARMPFVFAAFPSDAPDRCESKVNWREKGMNK